MLFPWLQMHFNPSFSAQTFGTLLKKIKPNQAIAAGKFPTLYEASLFGARKIKEERSWVSQRRVLR